MMMTLEIFNSGPKQHYSRYQKMVRTTLFNHIDKIFRNNVFEKLFFFFETYQKQEKQKSTLYMRDVCTIRFFQIAIKYF